MIKCYLYTISGRVQGVGYRYFVLKKSELLNIKGYVKNLQNGDVETLAIGNENELEQFEKWLYKGPSGSTVLNVYREEIENIPQITGFEIRY